MQNVTPDEWKAMSQDQRETLCEKNETPYIAANGHRLQARSRYAGGRPIWSSAWTSCTDDCPACADGEPLPDW